MIEAFKKITSNEINDAASILVNMKQQEIIRILKQDLKLLNSICRVSIIWGLVCFLSRIVIKSYPP